MVSPCASAPLARSAGRRGAPARRWTGQERRDESLRYLLLYNGYPPPSPLLFEKKRTARPSSEQRLRTEASSAETTMQRCISRFRRTGEVQCAARSNNLGGTYRFSQSHTEIIATFSFHIGFTCGSLGQEQAQRDIKDLERDRANSIAHGRSYIAAHAIRTDLFTLNRDVNEEKRRRERQRSYTFALQRDTNSRSKIRNARGAGRCGGTVRRTYNKNLRENAVCSSLCTGIAVATPEINCDRWTSNERRKRGPGNARMPR